MIYSRQMIATFLLLPSVTFAALDPARKESQLHNIYEKYHSSPTPAESWTTALEKQAQTESYTVASGDTLWDISQTLFADGFFWSKVWSLNPAIKNPHRISTGDQIQFTLGGGLQAPGLKVADAGEAGSEGAPAVVDSEVVIPPGKPRAPVPQGWPASLPSWSPVYDRKMRSMEDLQSLEKVRSFPNAETYLTYYVMDLPPAGVGEVVESDGDGKFASLGGYVFIKSAVAKEGDYFTVVRPVGEVKNKTLINSKYQIIQVQGQIKIIEQVDGYFKGQVVMQLAPIEVGSKVLAENLQVYNLDFGTEDAGGVSAQVIGGELDVERQYLGDGNLIFLNRGSNGGLAVGQGITIYGSKAQRNKNTLLKTGRDIVAIAKIVHVAQGCATAIVNKSYAEIMPGDFIGPAAAATVGASEESAGDQPPLAPTGTDAAAPTLEGEPSLEEAPLKASEDEDAISVDEGFVDEGAESGEVKTDEPPPAVEEEAPAPQEPSDDELLEDAVPENSSPPPAAPEAPVDEDLDKEFEDTDF